MQYLSVSVLLLILCHFYTISSYPIYAALYKNSKNHTIALIGNNNIEENNNIETDFKEKIAPYIKDLLSRQREFNIVLQASTYSVISIYDILNKQLIEPIEPAEVIKLIKSLNFYDQLKLLCNCNQVDNKFKNLILYYFFYIFGLNQCNMVLYGDIYLDTIESIIEYFNKAFKDFINKFYIAADWVTLDYKFLEFDEWQQAEILVNLSSCQDFSIFVWSLYQNVTIFINNKFNNNKFKDLPQTIGELLDKINLYINMANYESQSTSFSDNTEKLIWLELKTKLIKIKKYILKRKCQYILLEKLLETLNIDEADYIDPIDFVQALINISQRYLINIEDIRKLILDFIDINQTGISVVKLKKVKIISNMLKTDKNLTDKNLNEDKLHWLLIFLIDIIKNNNLNNPPVFKSKFLSLILKDLAVVSCLRPITLSRSVQADTLLFTEEICCENIAQYLADLGYEKIEYYNKNKPITLETIDLIRKFLKN